MKMPSTTFLNTFAVRDTHIAPKAARYAGMSVAGEYAEMMDELYALWLKEFSKDAIEGLRTTVGGDSRILAFVMKI